MDWWLGFRIFPLVKHSVKDEERTIGQEEWSTEKSWGARILSTMWIIWIVLCTGAPPNETTKQCLHCFSAQNKREDPVDELEEREMGLTETQLPSTTGGENRRERPRVPRSKKHKTEIGGSE